MKAERVKQLFTSIKFDFSFFNKKLLPKTMICLPKTADFKAWSHGVRKANYMQHSQFLWKQYAGQRVPASNCLSMRWLIFSVPVTWECTLEVLKTPHRILIRFTWQHASVYCYTIRWDKFICSYQETPNKQHYLYNFYLNIIRRSKITPS